MITQNSPEEKRAEKDLLFSLFPLWVEGYVVNRTCFEQRELVLYDQ